MTARLSSSHHQLSSPCYHYILIHLSAVIVAVAEAIKISLSITECRAPDCKTSDTIFTRVFVPTPLGIELITVTSTTTTTTLTRRFACTVPIFHRESHYTEVVSKEVLLLIRSTENSSKGVFLDYFHFHCNNFRQYHLLFSISISLSRKCIGHKFAWLCMSEILIRTA